MGANWTRRGWNSSAWDRRSRTPPQTGSEHLFRSPQPPAGQSLTFTIQETVEDGHAHDGQRALARAAEKESAIEFHQVVLYCFNPTSFEVSVEGLSGGAAA